MKRWIGLILIAALWGYGLVRVCGLEPFRGQVFMYYEEGKGVRPEAIEDAMEQEKETFPGITAWSVGTKVEVGNRELGRKEKADCIAVYGSKEAAAYGRLESGTYGYRSDKDGCVISRGLAMELFGSVSIAGKHVWCRDKAYVVRGVTDEADYAILIPAGGDDVMRHMVFSYGKDSSAKIEAERFLYKYGIDRGGTLVDGSLFFNLSGLCVILALWTVPAYICLCMRKKKGKKYRLLLAGAAAMFFLAGICLIWRLELEVPADIIPSRWSDFEFWTQKSKELYSDMEHMGAAGRNRWLSGIMRGLLSSIGCSVSALAGGMIWKGGGKKKLEKVLILCYNLNCIYAKTQ